MANYNGKRGPCLPDIATLLQAGIDPKTGKPIRQLDSKRKEAVKMILRVMDEQQAVNRYTLRNQPFPLSSQETERFLYYRGQLAMFYAAPFDQFFLMPFALDGTIDMYGRYNFIHPIPYAVGQDERDEKPNYEKAQIDYFSTLRLKVLWDVPTDEELAELDPTKVAVIVYDYTRQWSQNVIPRQLLQDPIIDIESDCIPFMRTNLLNSTGIVGVRVNNEDEQCEVERASQAINAAALEGRKYIPILGAVEMQELTGDNVDKSEEFLLAMQGLDNFRLSAYGLQEGGLFQKKSNMLQAEQQMNTGNASLVLQDGLACRQRACDIANAVWGLGMSWEVSEAAALTDMDMDGLIYDDIDQSGMEQGDQDSEVMTDE